MGAVTEPEKGAVPSVCQVTPVYARQRSKAGWAWAVAARAIEAAASQGSSLSFMVTNEEAMAVTIGSRAPRKKTPRVR
ncbi:hypothetical protein GCM10007918_51420 [Piscinibacter gummiphilus]|nr:hypothetical protein GCM10007918_51420 [Piscinibacter gummiphilus]